MLQVRIDGRQILESTRVTFFFRTITFETEPAEPDNRRLTSPKEKAV